MKTKLRNFCIGTLCLAFGLLNLPSCHREEPKEDFVKINKVIYSRSYISKDEVKYPGMAEFYRKTGVYRANILFDVGGFDNQRIKEINLYIDGEDIGYAILGSKTKHIENAGDGFYNGGFYVVRDANTPKTAEYLYFKKGKHTAEAILVDCKGNTTKDSYVFEVK